MSKLAILDLGSNSVRLVIYNSLERSSLILFNEKVLCELAAEIQTTSKLSVRGKELCEQALDRFLAICKNSKVKRIISFATAAIRDATDGKEYVEYLKKKYGIEIEIYSGEEEAKSTGLGVISTYFRPKGIVADLGGGSLELAEINQNEIAYSKSYQFGVLRLKTMQNNTDLDQLFQENFSEFAKKLKFKHSNLYLIGGSFRLIAKMHITHHKYPLRIVNQYQVKSDAFLKSLKKFSTLSFKQIKKLANTNNKRINNLSVSIKLLHNLIESLGPINIIFSEYGVREGVFYRNLSDNQKSKDPLIAHCSNIMKPKSESLQYGFELANWLKDLFYKDQYRYNRLILAACILSNLSRIEHNEYKAEYAYNSFIDSNIFSINHRERVYIATILYFRYSLKFDKRIMQPSKQLLTDVEIEECKKIGISIKIANLFSNSNVGILKNLKMTVENNNLKLSINKDFEGLYGSEMQNLLKKLCKSLNLNLLFQPKGNNN